MEGAAVEAVDLTPVVEQLEGLRETVEQIAQQQANQETAAACIFLAVCVLAGVVVGCTVARVLHDLWRA